MDNFFYLDKGEINKNYKIVDINGGDKIKRRLLDLGFVGTNVKILRKSSLKGVFLVELRNFVLSIKRNEISKIVVKSYE